MGKKIIFAAVIIFLFLCGLLILLLTNNLIAGWKTRNSQTGSQELSQKEISDLSDFFVLLNSQGDDVFSGLGSKNLKLIIFNEKYEFLISSSDETGSWQFLQFNDLLQKNIYRRIAEHSQAFAVKVGSEWIGSMSTRATLNKTLLDQIGFFFPPQFILIDKVHYWGTLAHELTHAIQGNLNTIKFEKAADIHNVCSNYYMDKEFNACFVKEGSYLEAAINANSIEELRKNVLFFLETRNQRRNIFGMSLLEVQKEKQFEWLEGMARYAEFLFSRNSGSLIAKNLAKIREKSAVKSDDRYYSTGMAQAMILDRLFPEWKTEAFTDDFLLEDQLRDLLNDVPD